jgi:hypothetical protein
MNSRQSAYKSCHPYAPRDVPGTWRLRRPEGCSAVGRIKSMKILTYRGRNRTRDLTAVPQPNEPPLTAVAYIHVLCTISLAVYIRLSIIQSL